MTNISAVNKTPRDENGKIVIVRGEVTEHRYSIMYTLSDKHASIEVRCRGLDCKGEPRVAVGVQLNVRATVERSGDHVVLKELSRWK